MRVIITGGTGLIGRSLVKTLASDVHEIIILSRNPISSAQKSSRPNVQTVGWDAQTAQGWGELITSESAIVNLAGASPAHWRWTQAYQARILESRLQVGAAIIQAIELYGPPAVLLQASASGYYGDRGSELLTEESISGSGFRARVCRMWETSTASARTRHCILRTGFVLDKHEGALPPLLCFAQLLGSRLGDGQQWLPWIHKEDVSRAIRFLLEHQELAGPFNLCAPQAVTNRDLIRAIQHRVKRFSCFPLPAFVLRLLLGELATVMLDSQYLLPLRLTEAGFLFRYPELDQALRHLLELKSISLLDGAEAGAL